jgi:bifunctional ADP-heptose synthase (sugar kinase/adenylyltransferase)
VVHFREARKYGDLLVVTVTPDRFVNKGPGRPVFSQQLRMETLSALEYIDFIALNEWPTAIETIRRVKPHAYVKGSDYADPAADLSGKISEEESAVRAEGGALVFTEGFTSSSSHIINRFFSAYPEPTQQYLAGLRSRYTPERIIDHLRAAADVKVLVVGEAILDQYTYCHPVGKSPKETIVSTKFHSDERFAGGAVATANHLAGFCREVTLLTALGPSQEEAEFLRGKLKSNVRLEFLRTADRPTVRKQRFVEATFMGKMFEIQYLDDKPIQPDQEKSLARLLETELGRHDLVVVNDFGHGLMTNGLREIVSHSGKFLALNTQSNSANHGYNTVTNYKRADYVAIDDLEMRLAARSKYGEVKDLVSRLRDRLGAKIFHVSRGAFGSVISADDGWHEAPALAVRIVDRVGAGDALFAVTSPLAFKGVPSEVICFLGNCVGALAVEIVGNRSPIEPVPLFKFVQTVLK